MTKYGLPLLALLAAALPSCGPQLTEEQKEKIRLSDERGIVLEQLGVASLKTGQWNLQLNIADIEMGSLSEKRETKLKKRVERRGSGEFCVDDGQAKSPPASFFGGGMQDCEFGKFEKAGDKLSVKLICTTGSIGSLEMKLVGPVSPGGYALAGDMAARLPVVGRVEMKGSITGNYAGGSCADQG